MSKHQIIRSLRQEIKKINYTIDRKIINGMPYSQDARRHKFLVSQLSRLAPPRMNWFSRAMSFASVFLF